MLVWYANRRALELVALPARPGQHGRGAVRRRGPDAPRLPGPQRPPAGERQGAQRHRRRGSSASAWPSCAGDPLRGQHPDRHSCPWPLLAGGLPAHPVATSPSGGGRWPGWCFSQVGIALLLGQAQAFTARWGAGGGALFLVGTCACLWLAARVPRMLGGLAALPAQAAGGATATARQYALMAAASATGNAVAGRAVLIQESAPQSAAGAGPGARPRARRQPGPTWRSQPLDPRPAGGPARPRAGTAPTSWTCAPSASSDGSEGKEPRMHSLARCARCARTARRVLAGAARRPRPGPARGRAGPGPGHRRRAGARSRRRPTSPP